MTEDQIKEALKGARILSISDEGTPREYQNDFGAYEVTIQTDRGVLRIIGAHDAGPELKLEQ